MDITLERILSLLPRKPDGKFVHGVKKEFAESIGLRGGNLVSDWKAGRSDSYRKYLYEISAKYNVSVEWLKGESDIKEKTVPVVDEELLRDFALLTPENQKLVRQLIAQLIISQSHI